MSDFKFVISMIAVIGLPIVGAVIGGVLYLNARKSGYIHDSNTKLPRLFVGILGFIGMAIGAIIMHFVLNS